MKKIKIKFHWSFLILCALMLIYGKIGTFFCCMICVLLHEMGHSLVGRHLGYKLNIITLLPYGAMLSGDNAVFSKGDEIKIAVAGPLVNAFLIILSLVVCLIFHSAYSFLREFTVCNIYTLGFNMLPVYPLDGGRIFYSTLLHKLPTQKAKKISNIFGYSITFVFFALFFISFFYKLNYMLGINALFLLIGLLGDDNKVYYEKLSSFDKFKPFALTGKIIKLDKTTPIFDAYKKIMESSASKVDVVDHEKVIKRLSKNAIISKVLKLPLNTTLEKVE